MEDDRMGRSARFDAEAREKFLTELRRRGNVADAVRAAGFGRTCAYEHRQADPAFAAAWDLAVEEAADGLEAEAWRRAVEGTARPVYHRGREVGEVREYSDTLLVHLLKAHRPEKYRERVAAELSGPQGGAIRLDLSRCSDHELLELRALLARGREA
jgi:hypothetical protein